MNPIAFLRRLFTRAPEPINTEAANDRPIHPIIAERWRAIERQRAVEQGLPTRDARGRFVKRRAF